MTMTVIEQLEAVKLQILEIRARKAEHKRLFVCEGAPTPLELRVSMDAQLASLEVMRHQLFGAVLEARDKARAEREGSALSLLIAKCDAAGMGRLVAEALGQARAMHPVEV